jgi:hypothetical protein
MHFDNETLHYFDKNAHARSDWRHRNSFYYNDVESFLAFLIPPGATVLHAGADSSALLQKLAPRKGIGIHPSAPTISQIQYTDKSLSYVQCELGEVPETFEFVVFSDILGHVHDVEAALREASDRVFWNGRIVITQYSALWEPILDFASKIGLRMPSVKQSWLSGGDLENFARLAGLEAVRRGTRVLVPFYIPLVSAFFNKYLGNIFPFTRLGLYHYVVLRKQNARTTIEKPTLSIVVPARNEAGMIDTILRDLTELDCMTELIFVEGHSSDKTYEAIECAVSGYTGDKKILYARQSGKGKGDAVRKGFDMATSDIITIFDADMTVPAADIPKFYRAIIENRGDFINGSRLVYPLEKQSMRFLNFLGNKFFSLAFSWLLNSRLKDTLCGTKMLWREDYHEIQTGRAFFGDFDPFGDFDLLFGASKLNRKIIDLPVHYGERTYGTTNIQRWRHGWLLLKMVVFAMRKIKFI